MRKKLLLSGIFLFLCFLQMMAQQRTITGKVTSAYGNPLVGASVLVVGQQTGERTGADGSFSIKVPANAKILEISYIGYEPFRVAIASQNNVAVTLQESSTSLNAVVVTGYSTQRRKDISGSIATVDISDAKKLHATSSEQLLQGQVSGVTVINSGAPGAASTVFVRGISNFGQTQPLYVIDGVQVGDMSLVNPNDIESISVLKDAGAAAIYGISGGNGVVVITTKKGRGKTSITYDGYYGTQRPLSGNPFHIMSPKQQSIMAFRANDLATEGLYPGGQGTIPTYGYHGNTAAGTFGAAGVTNDPAILPYYNFDANNPGNDFLIQQFSQNGTDWFHAVFKPAPEQQHTLTASGGNDKSNYLFSVNYLDQQGTLLNNYEKRYQARLNTNFSVKNNIRFGENAFVTYRENNGGYNGSQQNEGGSIAYIFRAMPILPVYDVKGNYGGSYVGPTGEPLGQGSNPYAILAWESTNKAHFVTVEGNIFAEADFLRHFTARTSFGGLLYNQYYWNITYNPYENYEGHLNPNAASENEQMSSQYNWTNTITYKQTFGKHNVQVFAGYEVKESSGRQFSASAQSFFSLAPAYVQASVWHRLMPNSYIYQPTSTESFFGRLDYIYNEKYILGATIRRDGYSIFYPGHQWGTFPSVSLAWRASQEDFLKGVSWLNNLKLRGSYGEAGNNGNIGGNNAYSSYASGTGSSYYGITGGISSIQQGFYQNQNGNPNVTWETDKITNVGLDATVFNNFDLTVEWYKKKISGLLFTLPLPNTVGGANSPVVNVGNLQNTGVDISAAYHGKAGKDFTFNIGANVTTYKSKIIYIPSPGYFDFGYSRDYDIVRNEVGHPIGAFFGFQTEGLYQDTTSAKKGATYSGASAGSFIYQDNNGVDSSGKLTGKPDGKIDANDRTWIGNPNPKFTYGVNLNVNYKGFDFSMILYGSYGNKDFNYVRYWTDFYSTFQGGKSLDMFNKAAIVANGVVTNPGATVPAASFAQAMGSSTISSYYVENGSFLKCRVASIGYTIDPELIKKVGIDKVHIYFQATNLFTITKYTGLDPELIPSLANNGSDVNQSAAFGIDYGAYPNNQKQYIVGNNLTF